MHVDEETGQIETTKRLGSMCVCVIRTRTLCVCVCVCVYTHVYTYGTNCIRPSPMHGVLGDHDKRNDQTDRHGGKHEPSTNMDAWRGEQAGDQRVEKLPQTCVREQRSISCVRGEGQQHQPSSTHSPRYKATNQSANQRESEKPVTSVMWAHCAARTQISMRILPCVCVCVYVTWLLRCCQAHTQCTRPQRAVQNTKGQSHRAYDINYSRRMNTQTEIETDRQTDTPDLPAPAAQNTQDQKALSGRPPSLCKDHMQP